MTERGEIARIAAALTEAQREAVIALGSEPSRLGSDHNWRSRLFAVSSAPPGIFGKRYIGDANKYWLTPLGLAVRATLEKSGE